MWPALWASFTPSKRLSCLLRAQMTSHVLSRLPSSTSVTRLFASMRLFCVRSSSSSAMRFAVMGSGFFFIVTGDDDVQHRGLHAFSSSVSIYLYTTFFSPKRFARRKKS